MSAKAEAKAREVWRRSAEAEGEGMSGHRWIRRLDGTVWLFISGVHCGTLMKRLGGSWSAHYATGEDIGQKDGPSTKASAKRALLRAVLVPRVKGKKAAKPVPANGWSGSYYRINGEDRAWAVRCPKRSEIEARVYLSHNPTSWVSATFYPGPGCSDAESEARAWCEARAGRKG